MQSKNNYKYRKHAFSYMELIISMSLVVAVMILSTPFLASNPIKSDKITSSGAFICYALYKNNNWVLMQNQRINKNIFESNDKEVSECVFEKPSGYTGAYIIKIKGAGAAGQTPLCESSKLHIGQRGLDGQEVGPIQSDIVFDSSGQFKIKQCENNEEYEGSCIGVGKKNSDGGKTQIRPKYDATMYTADGGKMSTKEVSEIGIDFKKIGSSKFYYIKKDGETEVPEPELINGQPQCTDSVASQPRGDKALSEVYGKGGKAGSAIKINASNSCSGDSVAIDKLNNNSKYHICPAGLGSGGYIEITW